MNNPLISVIIPVYNHGKYIRKTIESLLAQTYKNWELVVIDDGSKDNSAEVVKSFKDPRIRYYYQENRGVTRLAETINNGLWKTAGELVTMLPSDDTWLPHRLEKQIPAFKNPDVVLCFGRMNLVDENDKIIGYFKLPGEFSRLNNNPLGLILHEMLLWNFIPQPTVLIRRAALKKIGGYIQPPGLLAEDYPTHLELALVGEFRFIDIPLANYRMHGAQMSKRYFLNMHRTDIQYSSDFFRKLTPELQKKTGWTEQALRNRLKKRLHSNYFLAGRYELLSGNWNEARNYFIVSIRKGSIGAKIKSLVGMIFSYAHLDLEVFARISKRTAPLK